jgi:hypothetical protein
MQITPEVKYNNPMCYDNCPEPNDRLLMRSTKITTMSYDNTSQWNDILLIRSTSITPMPYGNSPVLMRDYY